MKIREISPVAARMIETPYRLGQMKPKGGFDCFSFVYWFYRELGVELPEKYGSYTVKNYADRFRENPDAAKRAMWRWLSELGEKVDPSYAHPGDFLIMQMPAGPFPAVELGNGNVLALDERIGVYVAPKSKFLYESIEVRRICPQP